MADDNSRKMPKEERDKIMEGIKSGDIRIEIVRASNIEFKISDYDIRGYDEMEGHFYIDHPLSEKNKHTTFTNVPIKFNGIAIDDDGNKYIKAIINGVSGNYTINDFRDELKSYSVTGSHLEKVIEFLILYSNDKEILKNAEKLHRDNIYLDENQIIQIAEAGEDLDKILNTIFKMYEMATSQDNFLINFAYFTIAPLSYFFRKQTKLFPFLINSGFHGTGKTSFEILFGNIGYAQDVTTTHFIMNDLKTFFTLMKSRIDSILPITLEDIELEWIKSQTSMLKGSAGTTNGGSRGYFNKVIKYLAKSQLAFDTNDMVDTDVAQLDRFLVCNFTGDVKNRINIKIFEAIKEELPEGFMFPIFNAVFGGIKLSNVINAVYNAKDRAELKINIIRYVLDKINAIMPENTKFNMPDFSIINNESNGTDWVSEIYNTGMFICDILASPDYTSTQYELNKTQIDSDNEKGELYITASGYSLLQKHLNLLYKSIYEMNNNNQSILFDTKISSHRFSGNINRKPVKCLIITKKPEENKNQ